MRKTTAGWALVLCVAAVVIALSLVFDPRYRDFPFAPLTAAMVPYLVLMLVRPRAARGLAEIVAAAVLTLSALFIAWNEGLAEGRGHWPQSRGAPGPTAGTP